jgi:hypothetical protein
MSTSMTQRVLSYSSRAGGRFAAAALVALAFGCWRDSNGVVLSAPFNDATEIGRVTAVWKNTGEQRSFAGGTRLKAAEVRFQYRVDVKNELDEPLYVRLGAFELVGEDGLSLGRDETVRRCAVAASAEEAVLEGSVWVAQSAAKQVESFRLRRFAVPLSERGRALYREWLLQRRPGQQARIDATLAAHARAPGCTAR